MTDRYADYNQVDDDSVGCVIGICPECAADGEITYSPISEVFMCHECGYES